MMHLQIIWRCMIMFLVFSIQGCSLLPADVISLGDLTVEPASPFLLGSNLTVYCHINECDKRCFRYKISLDLNGSIVNRSKRINCTTEMFFLPRIWKANSSVVCTKKHNQQPASMVVHGKDLRAGLPPDKPANINCETTRSSDLINCSWDRGQETYLNTSYNIILCRENGTQVLSDHIQNSDGISIRQKISDINTKYQLVVTAYNLFGESKSDPFIFYIKDIVIPEVPHVIKIEFQNDSGSGMLCWNTSESSEHLRPEVRLRVINGCWELGKGSQLSEGLIRVADLRPLTEYELQIRTCYSPSRLKSSSKMTRTSRCSKWSSSVRKMSPGKGPSQQLQVWRILAGENPDGLRKVTVLWKPPPPEDYSGELLHYEVLLEDGHKEICAASSDQCEVQVPVGVQTLSLCAVTTYGKSPPANVELRHAGISGPDLQELKPAAAGSSVHVSWFSTFGGELLYFVVEWPSGPEGGLKWKRLNKDPRNASISGLTAGVRYNVSLYAVTTRGASAPASSLIYSKEEKPVSGPTLFVQVHESRRILVQWDELPVDQQRGFILNYTIYLQALDLSSRECSVTVAGSGPGETWLDCPEGALTLQMTASNSAGEGPRGRRISSQPAAPAVGLVVMIVFSFTIFIVIVANLMCWSCVRKRIKQKCVSWGPEWLVENPPKPGHSTAIRLLEDDRDEPLLSSTYSDPPLSPILVISQEDRDVVYPTIHVEESLTGSGKAVTEMTLSVSDTRTIMVEHSCYKPQISVLVPLEELVKDAEEEARDVSPDADEDGTLVILGGLLEGLVSNLVVDYSGSSRGMTLASVEDHLWPKNNETIFLNSGFFQEWKKPEEDPTLNQQQDYKMTSAPVDPFSSLCSGETSVNSSYFPPITAAVSTDAPDTLQK